MNTWTLSLGGLRTVTELELNSGCARSAGSGLWPAGSS